MVSVVSGIYIIESSNTSSTLSGYNNLKVKTEEISKAGNNANNRNLNSFIKKLDSLDNSNLTKEEQQNLLKSAWVDLYTAYLESNEPKLYDLTVEFKKFIDSNYTENEFKIKLQCLDSACAEDVVPADIQTIINEIEKSSVPEAIKTDYTQQLKTFTYISDEQAHVKVVDYLSLAESIKINTEFEKAGLNLKIYNDIRDYVKNAYPDLYNENSEKIKVVPIE